MNENTPVGAIVALIIGVAIGILVITFVGTLSGTLYEKTEADISAIGSQTVNLSITLVNNTWVNLGTPYIHVGTFTLDNNSLTRITSGNYTLDNIQGRIKITIKNEYDKNFFNSNVVYAAYSYGNYTISNHITAGILSGFETLDDTAGYTPIIILAVVIVIVLSIVLGLGVIGGRMGGMGGAL